MSSPAVRTAIKGFLEANSQETVVDLTSLFEEIKELLAEFEVQPDAPWLGIQFIGHSEEPIVVPATNDQGKYREFGTIVFHIVAVAALGVGDGLLTRGEALRNLFRGRRIGDIMIDSVSPVNTDAGATLQFEGGFMSGSFTAEYRSDLDL